MKNAFHFTFWPDQKDKINFKITTSQPGKEAIAIHIFPSISRSKGNQTMKIGQLTEYNMRNIFLEKQYTKCGGEATIVCKLYLKFTRFHRNS